MEANSPNRSAEIKATALALIANIESGLKSLRQLLDDGSESSDPSDPLNKLPDGKLTSRGVETCYRLFDQDKGRYAVAQLMGISFGAATHRFRAWEKVGGKSRSKTSLA